MSISLLSGDKKKLSEIEKEGLENQQEGFYKMKRYKVAQDGSIQVHRLVEETRSELSNVNACDTTFEAVCSETALKCLQISLDFILNDRDPRLNQEGMNLKIDFLKKLQNKKLPAEYNIQEYEKIKENKDFKKVLKKAVSLLNYRIHGNKQAEVLENQREILDIDRIFYEVDNMILIARIESGEKGVGEKLGETYLQLIGDAYFGGNLVRNIDDGKFYTKNNHGIGEPLPYRDIYVGEGFLLFENYLISKKDYSLIKTFDEQKYEVDVLYLGDNVFEFNKNIFSKVNGKYSSVGKVGEEWNYAEYSKTVFIEGDASADFASHDSNVKFVNKIDDSFNSIILMIENHDESFSVVFTEKEEVMYTSSDGEKFCGYESFDNDDIIYDYIRIDRNGRDIIINILTLEEIEINNGLTKSQKFKNVFPGMKIIGVYNSTIDYVENFLLPIKNRGGKIPLLTEIQFGQDKEKSDEFKKKYLQPEKIQESLTILDREYNIRKYFEDESRDIIKKGLSEYLHNEPCLYDILQQEKKEGFSRFCIGDYSVVRNVRTKHLRLVKNLDSKDEEGNSLKREFIDLYKGFPIHEYQKDENTDRIVADVRLHNLLKAKDIKPVVKFFGDEVEGYISYNDKKYYYLEDNVLEEVKMSVNLIDSDGDKEYFFSLKGNNYTVIGTHIFLSNEKEKVS